MVFEKVREIINSEFIKTVQVQKYDDTRGYSLKNELSMNSSWRVVPALLSQLNRPRVNVTRKATKDKTRVLALKVSGARVQEFL